MSESIADILAKPSQAPTGIAATPWSAPVWRAERFGASIPGYELSDVRPRLMEPEGNGSLGVMFVGEAPGGHENATGLPFRPWAPAGSVLQRVFSELEIDRSKALISNAAWYQPPRNWLEGSPWEAEYLADGRPRNAELILQKQPRVLVALGGVAWHELTGLYHTNIEQGRGYIVPARKEYGGLPVVGTYHPSFIIRGSKRKSVETGARTEKQSGGGWGFYSVLKRDIALAMLLTQRDLPKTVDGPGIKKFATRDDWELAIRMCEENPNLIISYDFETPMSVLQGDESEFDKAAGSITQFQISLGEGHALVSSWDYSLMALIKRLFESKNRKLDWNGRGFDRDIMRNLGIRFMGEWHDGMRMWSHWERDLPRGLQYVASFVSPQDGPWKYLFEHDLRTYGVRDVIEPIRIFEFLERQMATMRHPSATARDVLWGYERQVHTLHTRVLDPLQVRGVPVNNARRLELRECLLALEGYVNDDINVLVPEHLKPTKQADGLKGTPKPILDAEKERLESEAMITAENEAVAASGICPDTGKLRKYKKPTKKRQGEIFKELRSAFEASLPDRVALDERVYVRRFFPIEDQFGSVIGSEKRWGELEDFNSNSSPQLLNYIGWRVEQEKIGLGPNPTKSAIKGMKWYVPMDFKTKRPTTEKKELDRLTASTKDEVLKLAVEIRELRKMRSTYVEGWAPKEDGRVHPFYDDNTGTGQLTAVNPAALTFPKHLKRKIHFSPGEDVIKVRSCKHAWDEVRPGHYICSKCGLPSQRYELGKLVRTMIEPRPGYRIIECVRPATRLLTWDLRWVAIKDLNPGDQIAGFDESPTLNPKRPGRPGRKIRKSEVVAKSSILKPCVRITTDKGSIECSKDHLLVSRGKNKTKAYGWIAAEDLKIGQKISFFTKPWDILEDRESAYLAGFFDGEGFMSGSARCGFGQNRGLIAEHVCKLVKSYGYNLSTVNCRGEMQTHYIQHPDAFSGLRFIGQIRPLRILGRTLEKLEGLSTWGKNSSAATILNIEDIGIQEVVALETTTHTYIAEGFLSHNCDYKAFHVLTTGFEANDADYMRLARLDMHSFIAATQLVNLAKADELLKLQDKDLMRVLKEFRKDERALYPGPGGVKVPFEFVRGKQAKPAILGYGFGMQPPRFYHENEEFLPSLDYAYTVFRGLDNQFPITCKWRKDVVMFVDRNNGILITRYGFVRRFSCCVDKFPVEAGYKVKPGEVIRVHKDGMHWCFGPGDDAEAIIACGPANDAFGMIKETMLRMEEQGLLEKFGLIIPIHDALVFECEDRYVDECLETVKREMERPSEVLILPNGEGLWCEAELSINKPGMSWADMEEVKM